MKAAILFIAATFIATSTTEAEYRTPNFIVKVNDPNLAKRIGDRAEEARKVEAIWWFGAELPKWNQPAQIYLDPQVMGGFTTFTITPSSVYNRLIRMNYFNNESLLFNGIIIHEVNHLVFVEHYRSKLPRWFDEGGSTFVEIHNIHEQDNRLKYHFKNNYYYDFVTLANIKEYPYDMQDTLLFYAESTTLSEYLIYKKGNKEFARFGDISVSSNNWNTGLLQVYGYRSYRDLQKDWEAWIKQGLPHPTNPVAIKIDQSQPPIPDLPVYSNTKILTPN